MNTPPSLLAALLVQCNANRIKLSIDTDGSLLIDGPEDAVTPELVERLKASKSDVLPRLFHNLRASRETELVEKYPVQVVTDWLGNTPKVALRHYLMTTDEHFEAAVKEDEPKDASTTSQLTKDGTADKTKTAQKAAQSAHAGPRGKSHVQSTAHEKTPVLLGLANPCDSVQGFSILQSALTSSNCF